MNLPVDREIERSLERHSISIEIREEIGTGALGFELSIILSFVVGQLAGSLIKEMTKDAWVALKAAAGRVYGAQKKSQSFEIQTIVAHPRGRGSLKISGIIDSPDDLEVYFEEAYAAMKLLPESDAALDRNRYKLIELSWVEDPKKGA